MKNRTITATVVEVYFRPETSSIIVPRWIIVTFELHRGPEIAVENCPGEKKPPKNERKRRLKSLTDADRFPGIPPSYL